MSPCQCGCPEVSLRPGRLPRSDCVHARVCVCVCVCGSCGCVGASAPLCLSCLFTLQGLGENRALLDPVTVSPLHPKSRPLCFFCAPSTATPPFIGLQSLVLFFCLIQDFNPTSAFVLLLLFFLPPAIRDSWRAERSRLHLISAPRGPARPSRDSQLERESEKGTGRSVCVCMCVCVWGGRARAHAVTMLALIKLVRNEFPVSEHTRRKKKEFRPLPTQEKEAFNQVEEKGRVWSLVIRRCVIYKLASAL